MKVLVDMNLSPRWVSLLSEAGSKAVHWSTIGPANAPDTEIMAYARANGYAVLTHDLDFSSILAATGGVRRSVIQIRSADVSVETIGASVVAGLRQMSRELEDGALLTVDLRRTRLCLLPLQVRG